MRDDLTARLTRLRAELNAIEARGWDGERLRTAKQAEIDAALEEVFASL